MKVCAALLYNQYQNDIEHCRRKRLVYDQEIECCFQLAYKYIAELNRQLKQYEFQCEEKEIEFFKKHKPKFTSELEYYNLVYQSLLFKPSDSGPLNIFWRRECGRLNKFKTEHEEFVACYYKEKSEMDAYYFLREFYQYKNTADSNLNDELPWAFTNGDLFAASLLAFERYTNYAEMQLENLSGGSNEDTSA